MSYRYGPFRYSPGYGFGINDWKDWALTVSWGIPWCRLLIVIRAPGYVRSWILHNHARA